MNTTKQIPTIKMSASLKLLLVCLFLLGPFGAQSHAREMQAGSDAYSFSTYMIDAFYSEGEECAEKLLLSPTIGWLCAAFPLGQFAFEERWDAYLSALPHTYTITAVTPWGDIRYEDDDTVFYGKIYDLNDGRLVVGYDKSDRGREIRLGFSSTANQATSTQGQNQVVHATPIQAAPVQQQIQQVQAAPVQQAQVFLTQAETRAREIAQQAAVQAATHTVGTHTQQATTQSVASQQAATQAAVQAADQAVAQHTAHNTAQTQQASTQQLVNTAQSQQNQAIQQVGMQQTGTFKSYDSQTAQTQQTQAIAQAAPLAQQATTLNTPRSYATPATTQNSTAMTNATTTTLATSAVMNAPEQTAISAMANAASTTLATSTIVSTPAAPLASTHVATTPVATTQISTPTSQKQTTQLQAVAVQQTAQIQKAVQQTAQPVQPVQPLQVQAATPAAPQARAETTTPVNTEDLKALAQSSNASSTTASAILDVFREKGLAVSNAKPMTQKDYGLAPILANEGLFFRLGDCTSCIGRIFSFDRTEDVSMMEVYYSLEAQATDIVYSNDKVLMQFFSTPKELAEEYISELKALN